MTMDEFIAKLQEVVKDWDDGIYEVELRVGRSVDDISIHWQYGSAALDIQESDDEGRV